MIWRKIGSGYVDRDYEIWENWKKNGSIYVDRDTEQWEYHKKNSPMYIDHEIWETWKGSKGKNITKRYLPLEKSEYPYCWHPLEKQNKIRFGTIYETNDVMYWRRKELETLRNGEFNKYIFRAKKITENQTIINTFLTNRLKKKCREIISELLLCHDLEKLIMSYI